MTRAEKTPAAPIHQANTGVHIYTSCARAGIKGRVLNAPLNYLLGGVGLTWTAEYEKVSTTHGTGFWMHQSTEGLGIRHEVHQPGLGGFLPGAQG